MKKKILIVDDCKTTRKLLSFMLKSAGFDTIEAVNGLMALEKLAFNEVDLILTDLNMPKMDGLELIKEVRNYEDFKHIPIIMVTTEADEDHKKRGLSLGANAYLTKPVSKEVLVNTVKQFIK